MDKTDLGFDVKKVCRLCLQSLQEDSLVSLFSITVPITPSEMVIRCASVQIYEKDGLPPAICNDCYYHLGIAYEFRNRCETSDQKLREYLQLPVSKPVLLPVEPAKEDEIYAAMTEIFGPEEDEDIHLGSEIDSLTGSRTLCEPELPYKQSKEHRKYQIKRKVQLDELLVKHKEKLRQECAKVKIFKQKRVSRKLGFKRRKSGLLKQPEQCLTCGKSFNYSGYLEIHQRIHSGEQPYECSVCKRRFTQAGNLRLHQRIHTNERKYQCEVCSKLFRSSSNLHAHIRTHSEVRNFVCSSCDRAFRTARELSSHVKTHSNDKNFVCSVCNKAFIKRPYLNNHMKTVHIGIKSHRCTECNKQFSNSSNLIAHRRIHTGEKPYRCIECDATFNQSSALGRHIRQQHKPKQPEPPLIEDPTIEVDENRSLESAASSELSVATSLIDNAVPYNMPYAQTFVQPPPQQQYPTANLYSSEYMPYSTVSSMQQSHYDLGSYDMCYGMPTSSVLNPSLMNSQPTYIFDQ